ncbi:unnamed protein product [Amoebophrya sp. A120]|nr:unnamed protein product [Amoebophrya sp. A120]|eukprot:GSA120T00008591001.1
MTRQEDNLRGTSSPSSRQVLGLPRRAPASPAAAALEDKAGVLSKLSFYWVFPLLKLNFKKIEDLPNLPKRDGVLELHRRLTAVKERRWSRGSRSTDLHVEQQHGQLEAGEEAPTATTSSDGSTTTQKWQPFQLLVTLLFRIQRSVFCYSFFSGWTFLLCMLLDPILLSLLLHKAEEVQREYREETVQTMGLLVLALSLCMILRVANMETCFFASTRVMNNARSAIVHAVFRESLYDRGGGGGTTSSSRSSRDDQVGGMKQSSDETTNRSASTPIPPASDNLSTSTENNKFDIGKWSNLMSTDADKLGKMSWIIFSFSQQTWAISSLPVVLFFLYKAIGVSATFGGMVIMFSGQFVMRKLATLTTPVVKKLQEARDVRSKLLNEYVKCVRLVKLQSLDSVWAHRLNAARTEELKHLKKQRYLNALNVFVGSLFNFLLPTTVFTIFILTGHELTGAVVFTTLAWIQQLNWSLQALPGFFYSWSELAPSLTRLAEFLNARESGRGKNTSGEQGSRSLYRDEDELFYLLDADGSSYEDQLQHSHGEDFGTTTSSTGFSHDSRKVPLLNVNAPPAPSDISVATARNDEMGESEVDIDIRARHKSFTEQITKSIYSSTESTPTTLTAQHSLVSESDLESVKNQSKPDLLSHWYNQEQDQDQTGAVNISVDDVVTVADMRNGANNFPSNLVDQSGSALPRKSTSGQHTTWKTNQEISASERSLACGYATSTSNVALECPAGFTCGYVDQITTAQQSPTAPSFHLTIPDNLQFEKSELIAFCGPVGSGKSTLLSCLAQVKPGLRRVSAEAILAGRSSAEDEGTGTRSGASSSSSSALIREPSATTSSTSAASSTAVRTKRPPEIFIPSHLKRAFVAQKPFLLNASIRENILFHTRYDEQKYLDVLQKCCLLPDLEQFPDYDQTLVGESGVQLSGGQKARVGLARAIYSDADVLFLDDVLSAVDAHTGRFLFDNVLCQEAKLGNKLVILITHQLQYLQRSEISQIFMVDNNLVSSIANFGDLAKKNALPKFLLELEDARKRKIGINSASADAGSTAAASSSATTPTVSTAPVIASPTLLPAGPTTRQTSTTSEKSSKSLSGTTTADNKEDEEDDEMNLNETYLTRLHTRELQQNAERHKVFLSECVEQITSILQTMDGHRVSSRLIQRVNHLLLGSEEETRFSGSIPVQDLKFYLSAFGTKLTNFFLFVLLVLSALSSVAANIFLTFWANSNKVKVVLGTNREVGAAEDLAMTNTFNSDEHLASPARIGAAAVVAGGHFFWDFDFSSALFKDPLGNDVPATETEVTEITPSSVLDQRRLSPIETGATTDLSVNNQLEYLLIYILINFTGSIIAATQTLALTICSLRASVFMHDKMLNSLLKAPLNFFDITPTGRILNRFLQDVQNIDNFVPQILTQQVQNTMTMLTQLILIFTYCPLVLVLFPVLVVPYLFIFKKIRSPARDTRRIESVAHSPVYSEYVDCLKGLETIQAFQKEEAFCRANLEKVTLMAKGKYWNEAICKWAQSFTTMWGCVIYLMTGLCGCSLFYFQRNNDSSGGHQSGAWTFKAADFGLVLLYAGILQRAMMDYCMGLTTMEQNFVSVERCAEYCRLPVEVDGHWNTSKGLSHEEEVLQMGEDVVGDQDDLGTTTTPTLVVDGRKISPRAGAAGLLQDASSFSPENNNLAMGQDQELVEVVSNDMTHPISPDLENYKSFEEVEIDSSCSISPMLVTTEPSRTKQSLNSATNSDYVSASSSSKNSQSTPPSQSRSISRASSSLGHPSKETTTRTSQQYELPSSTRGRNSKSPASSQKMTRRRASSILPEAVALEVRNLSFRYRLHKNPVLENVNFQIQKGEKVAIIGRSGSGKSSLFNALSGLYKSQPGSEILIGNLSLAETNPLLWRKKMFRMVSQDSNLISGTIRENLRSATSKGAGGATEATTTSSVSPLGARVAAVASDTNSYDSKIWRILDIVNLKQRVQSLPYQLDSEFNDDFSVGEKQLFAVARALIDDPELLLCDEATANIDLKSDEKIHDVILNKLGKETTVLWIMHRLHFVRQFDKVLIFHDGKLVESGTPAELLGPREAVGSGNDHGTRPSGSNSNSRLAMLMREADAAGTMGGGE